MTGKGRGLLRSGDVSKRQDSWFLILDIYAFLSVGQESKNKFQESVVSLNSVASGDGAQAIRPAAC